MPQPRIAVLIPAYNAEKTISRSLDSLGMNPEPHDIVVVDDGSRVPLETCVTPRPNLTILRAPTNVGIVKAMNIGLNHILSKNYDYIARLDADDEALSERLSTQRAYMDAHPDVGLVGSWGQIVSEEGKPIFFLHPPEDHEAIVRKLFYNNCLLHPSIMMRASLLRAHGLYSEKFPSAEDYEIFRRIARFSKVATLPRYLINYTISVGGISMTKRRQQLLSRLKVQWAYRDFSSIHFYGGLLKTAVLSLMPYDLITRIKRMKKEYQAR